MTKRDRRKRTLPAAAGTAGPLLDRLKPLCETQGGRLGLAPHSLRAVPPDSLRAEKQKLKVAAEAVAQREGQEEMQE